MEKEKNQIKILFEHLSIEAFVKYYKIFQKYSNSRSNKEIYIEFDSNCENWTKKSYTSRASKGKKIFRLNLEIDALLYIINESNEKKISKTIKDEALIIYKSL